jgi:hypothetical protein
MWIPILITLAVLVVLFLLFLLFAMFKSDDFRVSRSLEMTAPASKAFGQVNDLHCMNAWNPFLKLDPTAKVTYEGATSGVGAVCTWDGDKNVGAGRQTIVESQPSERVRMKLEFYRPFVGVNDVEFTFVPEGAHTVVTWCMVGKLNFMARLIGIFMSMEKMCGTSFEKGLADVKTIVEA